MKKEILDLVCDAEKVIGFLKEAKALAFIEALVVEMEECFASGGKLLIAGNGGSLCDAMHFAEELSGFFRARRKPFPAIALADPGHMSCVANDVGFHFVFSRYVEALGKKEDRLILLTTSGHSENLLYALEAAKKIPMRTCAFLGKTGGKIAGMCDLEWIVPEYTVSDRIQEAHMTAIHIAIELFEKRYLEATI